VIQAFDTIDLNKRFKRFPPNPNEDVKAMATSVEATSERVIEAAGEVFAEKGFESATVREICHRGKANLAAINYYFGDKRRLYVEAVKRAHLNRAQLFPLPNWAPHTPPQKKLADFVLTLLRRMISPSGSKWEGELMIREIASPTEACQELVHDYIRPHFEALGTIIAELMPDAPPEKRHLVAFSVVGQCLHYRVTAPVTRMLVSDREFARYGPELLAKHITDLTLHGIGAR
jgi:TetR/AcrR family transcriptional regulator, regulator of cefoperazone and chloramphenicol sensitivity